MFFVSHPYLCVCFYVYALSLCFMYLTISIYVSMLRVPPASRLKDSETYMFYVFNYNNKYLCIYVKGATSLTPKRF